MKWIPRARANWKDYLTLVLGVLAGPCLVGLTISGIFSADKPVRRYLLEHGDAEQRVLQMQLVQFRRENDPATRTLLERFARDPAENSRVRAFALHTLVSLDPSTTTMVEELFWRSDEAALRVAFLESAPALTSWHCGLLQRALHEGTEGVRRQAAVTLYYRADGLTCLELRDAVMDMHRDAFDPLRPLAVAIVAKNFPTEKLTSEDWRLAIEGLEPVHLARFLNEMAVRRVVPPASAYERVLDLVENAPSPAVFEAALRLVASAPAAWSPRADAVVRAVVEKAGTESAAGTIGMGSAAYALQALVDAPVRSPESLAAVKALALDRERHHYTRQDAYDALEAMSLPAAEWEEFQRRWNEQ